MNKAEEYLQRKAEEQGTSTGLVQLTGDDLMEHIAISNKEREKQLTFAHIKAGQVFEMIDEDGKRNQAGWFVKIFEESMGYNFLTGEPMYINAIDNEGKWCYVSSLQLIKIKEFEDNE